VKYILTRRSGPDSTDRIVVLRDGSVEQIGSPAMNVITGRIQGGAKPFLESIRICVAVPPLG